MKNINEIEQYRDISGIYYIIETSSKRVYIGSSVDIRRRVRQHYTDLQGSIHSNEYLQRTWSKYTEEVFLVGVVEVVADKERLLKREQHWIDFFKSANRDRGFNLTPTAGSNLGYKKTEEQIRNSILAIRGKRNTVLNKEEASKVKSLINEGCALKRIAEIMGVEYETVRSIRRGHSFVYIDPQIDYKTSLTAKLVEKDVIEIKILINSGASVKDIAEEYIVSHRTISAIKNEINWKHVGDKITIPMRKKRSSI